MENSRCTLGQRSFIEGENEDEVGEGNANQYQRSSSTSRDDRRTQETEDGNVADSMCEGLERSEFSTDNGRQVKEGQKGTYGSTSKSSGIKGEPKHIITREQIERFAQYAQAKWTTEPNVGRVAYGVPQRVDRLKGIGNAVVPQIPQFLGESILNFEKENI